MTEAKYASVLDSRESLLGSVFSDLVTFLFTSLMMYVSIKYDSAWWTLVTAVMWMVVVIGVVGRHIRESQKYFHNKTELLEWANSLPDDGEEK